MTTRLPRSTDDLRGLRAARWIRESTTGQFDRYGPESQREQQDAFLERFGLVDTGLVFQVAESGRTVWRSAGMAEMLESAEAGAFDVLVAGYHDRWQRNVRRTIELIEDRLHPAGVVWVMADRRLLSSDPRDWREMRRLANEAQEYSEKLGERITDGYAAKFRRRNDQGGLAPLGFRRVDTRLEVDPESIGRAVDVFERYASATVSHSDLEAETGIRAEAIREMLRAPVYNGWVRRHRRGPDEELRPAAWRDDPPVSDELWARVQEVRGRRYMGGGHPHPVHVHLLSRLLWCECGARLRVDSNPAGYRRVRHFRPCAAWPTQSVRAELFEEPIVAQVTATKVTPRWRRQLQAVAASLKPAPDGRSLRRRQLERELSDKALAVGQRQMSADAFLAEHGRITTLLGELDHRPTSGPSIDPERCEHWLSDLRGMWTWMDDAHRRDVIAALYDRITVTPSRFVAAKLTPAAEAHGIVLAMPERVSRSVSRARRAGAWPWLDTIPIESKRDWRRLARSA